MDSFQLLDEDQRYQLIIIRFLDLAVDEYITISRLVELTGQSKFKITKFIHILNYDLHRFRTNCKIVVQDDLLLTENLDLTVIKLLQIDYFKTSQAFSLLVYLIEERGTIEKYANDHFLSTSKAYTARRQLITFLKPLGIKIKKNRLVGDELSVRNTLSTLIFEALNGYYSPFTSEMNIYVKKVNELLIYFFDLRLTPTQMNKLNLLISISTARCKSNYSIGFSFFSDSNMLFCSVKNSLQHLSSQFHIDGSILLEELSYLSMFLYSEGLLDDKFSNEFDFSYFKSLDRDSIKLSDEIICQLERQYSTKLSKKFHDSYIQRVKQSDRKRAIFSFETSSFSTNKQIQSVNELYPVYSEIIWNIVEESFTREPKDSMSRRFYDYLFILLDVIPPEQIERPIHICVDFSQGRDYTNFIIKQIQGFKDLNFVIENKLTAQTNILISNCVWERFNGTQIVWKNPPTPSDWEFFGNTVVKIKRELLIENHQFKLKGGIA